MTIKVTGDPVDEEDLIEKKTQISWEITEITTESIEIVSKNKYKDTFKIPNELINQFQIWFETN